MDPNACLLEMRELSKAVTDGEFDETHATRLAELLEGLDQWLENGGFLPHDWNPNH